VYDPLPILSARVMRMDTATQFILLQVSDEFVQLRERNLWVTG
jgi:hypothetical protein